MLVKRMVIGILTAFLAAAGGVGAVRAAEEPEELYARSAVLMDADSGRVLFEKNGFERKPMASTTKIMTCILALENGRMEDVVTVSQAAARQPKVHLGMQMREKFYLRDLLYSLMLESHNDSAVAIAEHIGGSVKKFAGMMNQKAAEIGCRDTYFITPNGLDAADEQGVHATSAADLALIMSYCITKSPKREAFLSITQKQEYHFSDVDCRRSFACSNHNAFLQMMEGAISGKTGFTGDAGYCYVGALRRDGRTFVVALLGCGWPNNRSYKWSDTRKLMTYGLENYQLCDAFLADEPIAPVSVLHGIPEDGTISGRSAVAVRIKKPERSPAEMLLREGEQIEAVVHVPKELTAPVKAEEQVGTVCYRLNGKKLQEYPVVAAENVGEADVRWVFGKIILLFSGFLW